jgi:hypothetical protein
MTAGYWLKSSGFSLDEIRASFSAAAAGEPGARWKKVAKSKRVELDQEMRRLRISNYIVERMSACSCASIEDCGRAFLDAISKRRPKPPVDGATRRRRSAKRLNQRT